VSSTYLQGFYLWLVTIDDPVYGVWHLPVWARTAAEARKIGARRGPVLLVSADSSGNIPAPPPV
jgi:hypothetical protein